MTTSDSLSSERLALLREIAAAEAAGLEYRASLGDIDIRVLQELGLIVGERGPHR